MARPRKEPRGAEAPQGPVNERAPYRSTELGLLLLVSIVISGLYVLTSLGTHGHLPKSIWLFIACVLGLSLALHVAISFLAPRSSQVLLPLATLLNGLGYIEIARWNPPRAGYQTAWVLVSAVAVVLVLLTVRRVRDLDRYRYITLFIAIVLMLSPLIPHVGENINGARLWLKLGPFSFQPVEVAKIFLAIFFASYFAANKEMLSVGTSRLAGRRWVSLRTLIPVVAAWGFSILVLGAENDIGFAMLLFALFVAMIWVSTGRLSYVAFGVGMFAVGGVIGAKLFHQVNQRIAIWLDPWNAYNYAHGGRQLAYGWFGIAAGGMTGTGVGLGQSGATPALTTDMIFSALGEELGFAGVTIIISCFILFVGEGFRIAQRAHSDFARLTATALSLIIGFQAFFIMAGVLRVLPFTGITLPFMAFGGSSLVANYVIVALLLRISDENQRDLGGGEVRAISFDRSGTKESPRRTGRVLARAGEERE